MARLVAGIGIGNAITKVALAETSGASGQVDFLSSAVVPTAGIKGTSTNIRGLFRSLTETLDKAGCRTESLDSIRINEAAPMIGSAAMEAITKTITTESTIIGRNLSTPDNLGIGVGTIIVLDKLPGIPAGQPYIVIAPRTVPHDQVAARLSVTTKRLEVTGAVPQVGDGVLVHNRLARKAPIADEVCPVKKVPLGILAVIEMADVRHIVETLSNPFGTATLLNLEADVTRSVVSLAHSLVGNRSTAVIKTPEGDMQERRIPTGRLTFHSANTLGVDVDLGAAEIMNVASRTHSLFDITGEADTNVGDMVEKVRVTIAQLTNQYIRGIRITDLSVVGTRVPQQVTGSIANEFSMEAAVGIAVVVRTDRPQMERITPELVAEIGVPVEVGDVEADTATHGVFATPGVAVPITILDMGAGSTDASVIRPGGTGTSTRLASAGNMVTLMIQSKLGLDSFDLAGDIKRHPLAKVESVFNIHHEDGTVQFFKDPLPGCVYACTVVFKLDGIVPLGVDLLVETIRQVRICAREQVFVTSVIRALRCVSPTLGMHDVDFVALVNDSALDFEIPQLVTRALADYQVVVGHVNIHGVKGPRDVVAIGPVLGGVS